MSEVIVDIMDTYPEEVQAYRDVREVTLFLLEVGT